MAPACGRGGPPSGRGRALGYPDTMKKAKKFPLHPKHPERICWGCDKYCPADSLICGNGSGRTEHPMEALGEDWYLEEGWGLDAEATPRDGAR